MKSYKRFFLAFSCCLLSLVVFSTSVLADGFVQKKIHLYMYSQTHGISWGQTNILEGQTGVLDSGNYINFEKEFISSASFTLANVDGSVLLPAGYKYEVSIENILYRHEVYDIDDNLNGTLYFNDKQYSDLLQRHDFIDIFYTYSDGTEEHIISTESNPSITDQYVTYNSSKKTNNFKFQASSDKDILKIRVVENFTFFDEWYDFNGPIADFYFQSVVGFFDPYPMKVSINTENKEVGLLENIWGSITNGFTELGNKVESGFSGLLGGIREVFNAITNLPSKIWGFIENGLKSLFVPDEEYFIEYSDKWDSLMADRFGALYQVGDIVTNSWDNIMASDTTNTIHIPEVPLNLPGGTTFVFGGYDVKIVPDGFTVLVDALKLIVSILATYLFINGLIKRYDSIMEGK